MTRRSPRMALLWLVGLWAALPAGAQDRPSDSAPSTPEAREQSPTSVVQQVDDPWASPEIAAPRMDDALVRRQPAAVNTPAGTSSPRGPAWLRTSASLAGVVALIVLLGWGYRLVAGAGGRLSRGARRRNPDVIEIISRTNLSARQSLSLVRVGPQLVLIGSTPDSLRALSVISDPDVTAQLAGRQAQHRADSHSAAFQRCLETETHAYRDGCDDLDEAAARGVPGTLDIQHKLSQTVRRLRAAVRWA